MAHSPQRSVELKPSMLTILWLRRRFRKTERLSEIRSPAELQMALIISKLLRTGVLISAFVVLLGGIIYLARHGTSLPRYQVFNGEPAQLRDLKGILSMAFTFSGRGIIQLGLLILLATPIVRVALALVGFHVIHDRLYVVFTGIVLATLIFSLIGMPA